MATRKHNRGTTLLVILQVWLLPCHGFTFAPHGLGSGSSSAGALSAGVAERQSSFSAMLQPCPPQAAATAVFRATSLSMSMSDTGGEPFDSNVDEPTDSDSSPFDPPGPYRDEHTAGGSRFKELLARAKGEPGPPPRPKAKPRRILPPEGAPDYDDESQWQEQAIGSPDVPDPPLRQEMPGLDLGPELDLGGGLPVEGEAGISGGSRFSRMMNQARQNDDREEAGMAPRASPRSPQEVAKRAAQAAMGPAPVSKEEKERAIRAAVERQQKVMSKARGIDLDDPNLEGAQLARKKALSRAQAESQAGGYVPSSSAADDYLNALKADSQKKQRDIQAKLSGKPLPPTEKPPLSASLPVDTAADAPHEQSQPLPSGEEYDSVKPQKRTAASWSIQNKADVYMASLKGIKVDLAEDNPYLKTQQSPEELPPQRLARPPPPPPAPPLGPQMSYADKLKLAKEAKASGAAVSPAAAAAPAAVATAVPSPPAVPQAPPAPPPPARSRSDKQAQGQTTAVSVKAVDAPKRLLEQEVPESALLGEDAARAKMMKVMDLLTEHKTAGLVGVERVSELRRSLVDTREVLRSETYGSSGGGGAAASTTPPSPPGSSPPPPPPPQQQQQQQQQQQRQQQQQQPPSRVGGPPPAAQAPRATPTTSPENVETLRRCSALLQAHVHSSLAGQDLQALVEGLASCLTIVTAQVVNGIAAGTSGGSGQGAPLGQAPGAANGGDAVPDYVAGVQSVGGVLSDMGMDKKPASFMPEAGNADGNGAAGWTGGSLGEDGKAIASKALGYLLKHRGGKGYGRGRVKGGEAEAMVAALAEVTEIMQDEMVEE